MELNDIIAATIKQLRNGYRRYNTYTQVFSRSGSPQRSQYCNGFTATNIGDVDVLINGKILFASATPATQQGDSISFGGNEGEIYIGNIQITFVVGGAGTNPRCELIEKFYVDDIVVS